MWRLLAFFFVVVSLKEASGRHFGASARFSYSPKIVNGELAEIEEHPYHVALHDTRLGAYFCGGSIIAEKFVLSAAHCLRGTLPSDLKIHAGSKNRYNGGIEFSVESFWLHSDFEWRTLEQDIAILRTFVELRGPNIAVIKLPPLCEKNCCGVCDGTKMTVTGFGMTETGSPSQWLRRVSKPVFDFEKCNQIWSISDGMFCTDSTLGDSCFGDSGGAVVDSNDIQQGVVSFGSLDCRGSAPAVYVRLEAPINRIWISQITGV